MKKDNSIELEQAFIDAELDAIDHIEAKSYKKIFPELRKRVQILLAAALSKKFTRRQAKLAWRALYVRLSSREYVADIKALKPMLDAHLERQHALLVTHNKPLKHLQIIDKPKIAARKVANELARRS